MLSIIKREKILLIIFLSFVVILTLSVILNQTALAYTSDIEKEEQQEVTLYWGDRATFRNYTIEAISFTGEKSTGSVRLKLYKDGIFVDEQIMSSEGGETWNGNNDDEIWIDVTGFYINPLKEAYVKLGVALRGIPTLSIEVNTDADSYRADRDILLAVKVKNDGSDSPPSGARTGDVKLNIDTGGLAVISGEIAKSYYEIKRGQEMPEIKLTLDVPSVMERTGFSITATCTGYDAKNKPYNWTSTKTIYIDSILEMHKTVSGGYIESQTPTEIYIDETASVNILIKNYGDFAVNGIKINDSITSDFVLKSGITQYEINITPGEQKNTFYILTPIRIGTYTLPKMTANWSYGDKNYSFESEQPSIIVHGPYIELKKTVNKTTAIRGETVKVIVAATNKGDRTCIANILDEIPNSTGLVSGNLSSIAVLKAKESVSTSYEIRIDGEGSIILPNATCSYADIKQYRAIAKSDSITINIPAPTPTPVPTQFIPSPPPAPPAEQITPTATKTAFEFLEPITKLQWSLWLDAIIGVLIGVAIVFFIKRKPKA